MEGTINLKYGLKKLEEAMGKPYNDDVIRDLDKVNDELQEEAYSLAPAEEEELFPNDIHDYWVVPEFSYKTITTKDRWDTYSKALEAYEDTESEESRKAGDHAIEVAMGRAAQ